MSRIKNKAKGIVLAIFGIALVVLIYHFDGFFERPKAFGTKAILGFIFAGVTLINGIRIYRRK